MYCIVYFYDGVVSESNPLGLSTEYPKNAVEVEDAPEAAPAGTQIMTVDEYNAYHQSMIHEYDLKIATMSSNAN